MRKAFGRQEASTNDRDLREVERSCFPQHHPVQRSQLLNQSKHKENFSSQVRSISIGNMKTFKRPSMWHIFGEEAPKGPQQITKSSTQERKPILRSSRHMNKNTTHSQLKKDKSMHFKKASEARRLDFDQADQLYIKRDPASGVDIFEIDNPTEYEGQQAPHTDAVLTKITSKLDSILKKNLIDLENNKENRENLASASQPSFVKPPLKNKSRAQIKPVWVKSRSRSKESFHRSIDSSSILSVGPEADTKRTDWSLMKMLEPSLPAGPQKPLSRRSSSKRIIHYLNLQPRGLSSTSKQKSRDQSLDPSNSLPKNDKKQGKSPPGYGSPERTSEKGGPPLSDINFFYRPFDSGQTNRDNRQGHSPKKIVVEYTESSNKSHFVDTSKTQKLDLSEKFSRALETSPYKSKPTQHASGSISVSEFVHKSNNSNQISDLERTNLTALLKHLQTSLTGLQTSLKAPKTPKSVHKYQSQPSNDAHLNLVKKNKLLASRMINRQLTKLLQKRLKPLFYY